MISNLKPQTSTKLNLKPLLTGLLLLFIFFVGYIREAVFLVINSVYKDQKFPYNYAYITPPDFLYQWNETTLLYLKWGLTLFFSLTFTGLTLGLIHYYFKIKKYDKFTLLIYGILILFAAIVSIIGIIINSFDSVYTLSRFIIGLVQSPLISLVLFVLFYFISNQYKIKQA